MQLLGGVRLAVAFADQLDRLVQGVEDDAEAFQDVDAPPQLLQLELEAPPHRRQAEIEEVAQHLLEAEPPGLRRPLLAVRVVDRHQAGQVEGEVLLQGGVLVEVGHDQVRVGRRLDLQDDAHAFLLVHLVGEVQQLRQLALVDDDADVRFQLALVHAVGNRRDDDLLLLAELLQLPFALHLDAAGAFLVNLAQRGPVGDDLAAEGEVGALDLLHDLGGRRLRSCRSAAPPPAPLRPGCAAECSWPCRPRCPTRR